MPLESYPQEVKMSLTAGIVDLAYVKNHVGRIKGPNNRFLTFWWLALFEAE
jgi:hypothetical protein